MTNIEVLSRTQKIVPDQNTVNAIEVLSRTQRIIISPNNPVSVINAGPPGPPGANSQNPFGEGEQTFPSVTWILDYDLGGKPAAFRFFDETGQEWEPQEITYINEKRSVAQWPEPMMGSWVVS